MTRPPRQSDILRAIKAAQDAGLAIARVEITADGRIVLTTGQSEPPKVNIRL